MSKFNDLTGRKFGQLTCLEYLGKSIWKVECDCGEVVEVISKSLMSGATRSCGCLRRQVAKEVSRMAGAARHAHVVQVAMERAGETDLRQALIKALNSKQTQREAADVLLIAHSTLKQWKRRLNIKRIGSRYV